MHEETARAASQAASATTVTLVQYGAIGVLLLVFLGVFLWLFYRIINKMLSEWSDQWKAISGFMGEQVKALQAVRDTLHEQQKEVLAEFRSLHREPREPTHPSLRLPPPARR